MPTTYYLDLSEQFEDKTGLDHTGNQLLGPGGWLVAQDGGGSATALVPGDTLYVKGQGDQKRLVQVTTTNAQATWAVGDNMRDNGGGAVIWSGPIVRVVSTSIFVIELRIGYEYKDVVTANGILNATKDPDETDTLTAKAGVLFAWLIAGTAGVPISLIGCDAAWTPGTAAVLNGAYTSGAPANQNVLSLASGAGYLRFTDLEVKYAVRLMIFVGACPGCYFKRVNLHHATSHNLYANTLDAGCVWDACKFNNAGSQAMYRANGRFINCQMVSNADSGVELYNVSASVVGCEIRLNALGITTAYANTISGNLLDSNTDHQIQVWAAGIGCLVEFNRIIGTAAEKCGIYSDNVSRSVFAVNNSFENTAGDELGANVLDGGNWYDEDGTPDWGCVDYAGGDFSTDPAATRASVAVVSG
ncbi:MAG: right-handed parallel beta-helix repeat-containing protein [Acidobacteria bacterium]|nr:right-handed parallel beta-helix repeat-containing protein [Acidobacteriota bacterium]